MSIQLVIIQIFYHNGSPNYVNNFNRAPIIVDASKHLYYKPPSFYAIGHYSKFLLPGSQRIGHTESGKVDKVHSTIFVRPDGGTVVLTLNQGNDDVMLTIDDHNQKVSNTLKAYSLQIYIYY